MIRQASAALAFALAATSTLAADTYVIDKAHSEVAFQIRHFVTKVRGRFTDFTGTIVADHATPGASSVEFTLKAASVNTDMEFRDKDLRSPNFFDVDKYPEITFKSGKVLPRGKDAFDVTGTLTLHGVSQEVTLPIAFLGTAKTKDREGAEVVKAGFETSVTLNRKDYGITWNRALDTGGFMLGDEVAVSINLEANRQASPAPK